MAKPQIISKTKWHRLGPGRVRRCLECGDDFSSTAKSDRMCPECRRKAAAAMVRSIAGNPMKEYKDEIHTIFDPDIVLKHDYGRLLERRAALARWIANHPGDAWWAQALFNRVNSRLKEPMVGKYAGNDDD